MRRPFSAGTIFGVLLGACLGMLMCVYLQHKVESKAMRGKISELYKTVSQSQAQAKAVEIENLKVELGYLEMRIKVLEARGNE